MQLTNCCTLVVFLDGSKLLQQFIFSYGRRSDEKITEEKSKKRRGQKSPPSLRELKINQHTLCSLKQLCLRIERKVKQKRADCCSSFIFSSPRDSLLQDGKREEGKKEKRPLFLWTFSLVQGLGICLWIFDFSSHGVIRVRQSFLMRAKLFTFLWSLCVLWIQQQFT